MRLQMTCSSVWASERVSAYASQRPSSKSKGDSEYIKRTATCSTVV